MMSLKNNNFDRLPTLKIICLADEIEKNYVLKTII